MKLLPKYKITIYSNDTVTQALEKLIANVSPRKGLLSRRSIGNTYFTGFVNKNFFEAERSIGYRNSFLPKIKGTIEPNGRGCAVHLNFKLNDVVFAFMIVWMSFATIAASSMTISMFTKGRGDFSNLLGWLFPLFGFALATFSFNYERRITEDYLIKLFNGAVNEDWN